MASSRSAFARPVATVRYTGVFLLRFLLSPSFFVRFLLLHQLPLITYCRDSRSNILRCVFMSMEVVLIQHCAWPNQDHDYCCQFQPYPCKFISLVRCIAYTEQTIGYRLSVYSPSPTSRIGFPASRIPGTSYCQQVAALDPLPPEWWERWEPTNGDVSQYGSLEDAFDLNIQQPRDQRGGEG